MSARPRLPAVPRVAMSLLALVALGFGFAVLAPGQMPYLLLAVALTPMVAGAGALLGYRARADRVERRAVVRRVSERLHEVAESRYSTATCFWPCSWRRSDRCCTCCIAIS